MNESTHLDLFNMFCGKLIGEGIHRMVFACKVRPDLVVKVEADDGYRYFANVFEQQFWDSYSDTKDIGKWLAPCEFMSPDGRILLQKKCYPLPDSYKLPALMPAFFTDLKRDNFGLLDGRLVCVDYAITIMNPVAKLTKADWS